MSELILLLQKLFAGSLGFILFFIAALLNLIVVMVLHTFAALRKGVDFLPTRILELYRWLAPQLGQPLAATVTLFAGLILFSAVTCFCLIAPFWSFFNQISKLITATFTGIKIGWQQGLAALFAPLKETFFADLPDQLPTFYGSFARVTEELLPRPASPKGLHPMTEEQFNALELTAEALDEFRKIAPLTEDELEHLKKETNKKINSLVKHYENLNRLDSEECTILFARPDLKNTILLVKQYYDGKHWKPVPSFCHIFDKENLKNALLTNAVNPVTHESILDPSPFHGAHGKTYKTRYAYHNYFDGNQNQGISQDVSFTAEELRSHLKTEQSSVEAADHQHDAMDTRIEPESSCNII